MPSGSRYTVKDITLTTKANVKAESRTIDYGTKLTAKDLVTNTDVFPEGTTFQYVGNESNWMKPGSYNDVQITATYYDQGTKKNIVTPVAHCNVAINDSRRITVLNGYTAYTRVLLTIRIRSQQINLYSQLGIQKIHLFLATHQ